MEETLYAFTIISGRSEHQRILAASDSVSTRCTKNSLYKLCPFRAPAYDSSSV